MVALQLFVGRTRIGRSMRSTAADRDAAALMGVNINRTIAITFLIGSALAGAAGVVYGLQYGVARFDLGFQAASAFTAAVLGGIGNTVGAALGGFIIGFIEVAAVVARLRAGGPAIVFGDPRHRARVPALRPARPADRRARMSAVSRTAAQAPARRPRPAGRVRSRHRSSAILIGMALVGLLLPVLASFPPFTLFQRQIAWIDGFTNAGVFVLLAIGLNIVVGVAGLLDLGYAAFFAIGAYTYAYVAPFGTSSTATCDLAVSWPMLLVGAVVAALFGILLGAPTLRLRGDYLAIVTLGFGEIVPIVFLNSDAVTNGINGIGGLARPWLPIIGGFSAINPWPYYVTILALVTIIMCSVPAQEPDRARVGGDPRGRAGRGRERHQHRRAKLLAFALGASTAGFAGVFNASKLVTVSPDQFTFVVSFTVLAMVVLGGMGNFWGVAIGAFVIYTINNVLLKSLNQFFDTTGLPDPQGHRLHPAPVPALRPRPGGDDAAATRGPVPQQQRRAGAAQRDDGPAEQDELGSVGPATTEEDHAPE